MNRRNFLQTGSLALVAAAGLPKAIKAAKPYDNLSTYRTQLNTDLKKQWLYEVSIDHDVIDDFAFADDTEKQLELKVANVETANPTAPLKQGEYNYTLTDITAGTGDNTDKWILSTKFVKKVSGNHTFDKSFPKNPKLILNKYGSVDILGKDNKTTLQHLEYVDPSASSGSGGGCFLTTACVQHMQLADDCEELQTLRYLRDNFMQPTATGNTLVKEYYQLAPALVKAIDTCSNKAAIYNYMYSNMILPCVQLIKTGKHKEAVAYYKTFAQALQQQYS